jgi:hypothetical protein
VGNRDAQDCVVICAMGGIAPRTSLESCHQHVRVCQNGVSTNVRPTKQGRKISNAQRETENSLYEFTASHKSRDTSSRRYAIRIRETKESRTGVIVHIVILGQSSWGHSRMRAHETWWGNAHVQGSSHSIELSWWRRSWWSVRGNARGQLFE